MSLQLKFITLLAALAAATVIALVAAQWTIDYTYHEIREPIESSTSVLRRLLNIERNVDDLRALASPGDAFRSELAPNNDTPGQSALTPISFQKAEDSVLTSIGGIADESWSGFAGISATENLRKNFRILRVLVREDLGMPVDPELAPTPAERERGLFPPGAGSIRNKLFQLHELLKKMEDQVVSDLQELPTTGDYLRRWWLRFVLLLALLLVLLTAGLGVMLLKRWVLRPVAGLRTAAARIAAGDLDHRIPLPIGARDELIALSAEVNDMAGMVKRVQTERVENERLAAVGEMVQRLAHNIRNPLAGIRGLAEFTRGEVASLGPIGDEVRETQGRIITAVDRFERWLVELLDVTRPARIAAEPTPVADWLRGLVDAHRPLALTRGVGLVLDQSGAPNVVTVDSRHLDHAVSAILSNAIDAASSVENPLVRVESFQSQNRQLGVTWNIRIEDNGPGVPAALRDSIFKPYFTTKKDGNGIGLALAQQVVRAHGGWIELDDVPKGLTSPTETACAPGGAAFVIRIPMSGQGRHSTDVASIGQ